MEGGFRAITEHAGDVADLMVIGHNPSIHMLALSLAKGGDDSLRAQLRAKYPTAALSVIDLAGDSWSAIRPGGGMLVAFVTPASLGLGGGDDLSAVVAIALWPACLHVASRRLSCRTRFDEAVSFTTFTDEARIALDNVADFAMSLGSPSLRLGVTGLSRAGKTVFITALIHNLIHGGRLPMFEPWRTGRLIGGDIRRSCTRTCRPSTIAAM